MCFVHRFSVDNVNNSVNNLYKHVSDVDKTWVTFLTKFCNYIIHFPVAIKMEINPKWQQKSSLTKEAFFIENNYLWFEKHSLQYTGLSICGLKGIFVSAPHSAHTASYISLLLFTADPLPF